jgi:hypothetical protein
MSLSTQEDPLPSARRRRWLLAPSLVLGLLGLLGALAVAAPPAVMRLVATSAPVVGPGVFGMHSGCVGATKTTCNGMTDHWPYDPAGSYSTWDSGISWASVEPSLGSFVWTAADAWVNAVLNHHDSVLFVLGPTPKWASSKPNAANYQTYPPSSWALWTSYVTAVATHFKGKVHAYEVWNEPDINTFWNGSIQQMVTMTKLAYTAIKKVDSTAAVVSPGIDARSADNSGVTSPAQWLSKYLYAGAKGYFNVFGVHLYPHWGQTPEQAVGLLSPLRTVLSNHGLGGIAVWDTEIGYGHDQPGSTKIIYSGPTAAAYVMRTYLLAVHDRIARTYWYKYDAQSIVGLFLTDSTGQLTTGGVGYQTVYDWMVGAGWSGCSVSSGLYRCKLDYPNATGWAIWNPARSQVIATPAGAVCVRNWLDSVGHAYAGKAMAVGPVPVLVITGHPSRTATGSTLAAGRPCANLVDPGYLITASTGQVWAFNTHSFGSETAPNGPLIGLTPDIATRGYWLASRYGNVYAFHAPNYGSEVGKTSTVVGIAADQATGGYWLATRYGTVYGFDAPRYGSVTSSTLVGIAYDPATGGYWLVSRDGNVYAYHATNYGSAKNTFIVGMAADPATGGYWLVNKYGNVFAFHAPKYGTALGKTSTVVGITADPATGGYWLLTKYGKVYAFHAPALGSAAGKTSSAVGITVS